MNKEMKERVIGFLFESGPTEPEQRGATKGQVEDFIVKLPKGYVLVFYRRDGDIEYTDNRSWAFIYGGEEWEQFWSTFEDVELITCGPYG